MIHKILLIEDQLSVNRRAIEELVNNGYQIVKAISPSAAKKQLHRNPDVDLIILDCIMPPEDFSGEETHQGTLTGYVIYNTLLREMRTPIVLWTVLGQAFQFVPGSGDVNWGDNVVLKVRKRMEKDELVSLVERVKAAQASRQ